MNSAEARGGVRTLTAADEAVEHARVVQSSPTVRAGHQLLTTTDHRAEPLTIYSQLPTTEPSEEQRAVIDAPCRRPDQRTGRSDQPISRPDQPSEMTVAQEPPAQVRPMSDPRSPRRHPVRDGAAAQHPRWLPDSADGEDGWGSSLEMWQLVGFLLPTRTCPCRSDAALGLSSRHSAACIGSPTWVNLIACGFTVSDGTQTRTPLHGESDISAIRLHGGFVSCLSTSLFYIYKSVRMF